MSGSRKISVRGRFAAAFAVAVALVAAVTPVRPALAAGEARTALVIGNGAYSYGPLANAVNDATDMAEALRAAGFEVIFRTEADRRAIDEAIEAFETALAGRGGVGLFYYSGHGVQIADANYMLPIGEAITHERDVKYEAVNVGRVLDVMSAADNALNVVVLDACRNNPLKSAGRSASRGLARVSGTGPLFIAYSTAPGEVAADGDGRNSPFTAHLVRSIATPGLDLEDVFKETAKGVYQDTGGEQLPWVSSSFFGKFMFTPAADGGVAAPRPEPAALSVTLAVRASPPDLHLAGLYRVTGTNPNGSVYSGMAALSRSARAPDELTVRWWIGKRLFSGHGRPEGRWFTVTYDGSNKAIYTAGLDGTLDGTWADGSATDRLTRFAEAGPMEAPAVGGRYDVRGRYPNGATYRGTARVDGAGGGRYRIEWNIDGSVYAGSGMFEGGVLTVDWGDSQPVIYVVGEDRVLTGLWAGGMGEDVLTPTP